jgi:hypothetical protein
MKTIITLLLTCVASFAATTYPVLTDNANRQFTGGATNLSLLNANQTFTGTNTFTAANLFPANNIGVRLLWSSPTNIYISSVAVGSNKTNNGDFASISYLFRASIPPLMGSNSYIGAILTNPRTNTNSTACTFYLYAGSNTNFVGTSTTPGGATTVGVSYMNPGNGWMTSANSWTNQFQGNVFASPLIGANSGYATNFTDTSSTFTLYFGAATATSHTNLVLTGLRLYEIYSP